MDAVRNDWQTPPEEKVAAVDELLELLKDHDQKAATRVAAFRALQLADRDQWERLNPELAGKVKGGTSIVNTQQVAVTGDMAIALLQRIEQETGQKVMSVAMSEVEREADKVLPPEVL